MSTRSMIAIKNELGVYKGVYCHYDGYDEDKGVGPTLREFYNALEKANELISLGSLSYLKKDKACAYHRDYGEKMRPAITAFNLRDIIRTAQRECDANYLYIFEEGAWNTYYI